MCLSIALKRSEDVLAKGTHLGFEWMVIHNAMGFRYGYVKVPSGHPWHGKGYDEIDANVHGGLTFADYDVLCDQGGSDGGYWIGFDCAHAGDAPDPALNTEEPFMQKLFGGYGEVRSQAYVEAECLDLCEQARSVVVLNERKEP